MTDDATALHTRNAASALAKEELQLQLADAQRAVTSKTEEFEQQLSEEKQAYSGLLSSFEQLSRENEEVNAKLKFAHAQESDYKQQLESLRAQVAAMRAPQQKPTTTDAASAVKGMIYMYILDKYTYYLLNMCMY